MPLANKTKKIDGHDIFVSQLPPLKAARLMTKVTGTLGPLLKGFKGFDFKNISNLQKGDSESIAEVVGAIAENVDEDKLEKLLEYCLVNDYVKKNQRPIPHIDMDEDFQETPLLMYKIAFLFLEVNFKNFTKGAGILEKISAKLEEINKGK